MERIYLNYSEQTISNGLVKVNLFLKDVSCEHTDGLKGFLRNQGIKIAEFQPHERQQLHEFPYFNDGFIINFAPHRWTFFKMRNYIYQYLEAWHTDTAYCSRYLKEINDQGKTLKFDDHFYVELSKMIDQAEDRYFLGNRSISLFVNSILHIMHSNLQLYWASAALENIIDGNLNYTNYHPASVDKKEIMSACSDTIKPEICTFPVIFHDEHIANFFIHLSPFSPARQVAIEFVEYILGQIDDFIYGDILFRKETYKLRCRIAELEKITLGYTPPPTNNPAITEDADKRDLLSAKILLLGDSPHIKQDKLLISFSKAGFSKRNITLMTEYDKMKSLDLNNLKRMRSKYDGILLGPMPHKLQGDMDGTSLIGMMDNAPGEYPPFAIIRDTSGGLHISKNSLKTALQKLVPLVESYNNYNL